MFLHVGGDVAIRLSSVIAIIDVKSQRRSRDTRDFLEAAEKRRELIDVSSGRINAYVVTQDRVYASSISSQTLKRRTESTHQKGLLSQFIDG